MSYTRRQFCVALLQAIGNNNPTAGTVNFMIGWSVEESGHNLSGAAAYNLWNTTQPLPGSTTYNFANVQNYTSFNQGVHANAQTLNNGLYPNLITALKTNNTNLLGVTGAMSPAIQGDLSVWVQGKRTPVALSYVNTIVAIARNPGNAGNDVASGTPGPVTDFGGGAGGSFAPGSTGATPININGVNLTSDTTQVVTSLASWFGINPAPGSPSFLDQVHETLVKNPGFYGMALAIDEAEQFPGYENLTTGPFDFAGMIRSVGATTVDNFVPFAIRSGLVAFGLLIVGLLIAKVALGVAEKAGPLIEAGAALA